MATIYKRVYSCFGECAHFRLHTELTGFVRLEKYPAPMGAEILLIIQLLTQLLELYLQSQMETKHHRTRRTIQVKHSHTIKIGLGLQALPGCK